MKVTIDRSMTDAVMAEFEADNPGKSYVEMSSAEFADRMMKKIMVEDSPFPEEVTSQERQP